MKSKRPHYFSTPEAVERLERLGYLERATAHILAGWIVKTPDLEQKIAWGRQLAANMEQAARLHDRALALRSGEDADACIPAAWREAARAVDGSQDADAVATGLVRLKRRLLAECEEYLDRADPVADAGSLALVRPARAQTRQEIRAQSRQAPARAAPFGRVARGERLPLEQGLWPPLDRAPRVARPAGMRRGEPGALRLLPLNPRSRKDTGLFLHNFLNEEFTTLELVARNSYEHPEMPWAFHRDAARHAGDEARHAQLLLRALPDYGLRYGDYPLYTYSYEGEYEFPAREAGEPAPCAPGSSRELLWRLLLRQVVHEGLALDSTAFEIRKREYLKQRELARIFGYTLADEIFHAGAGLKWSRYLVGGDEDALEREREAAYGYYAEGLKERRLRWGAAHLEAAAAEAEQLDRLARRNHFPFALAVNERARRRAGYSEADIRQARDESSRGLAASAENLDGKED